MLRRGASRSKLGAIATFVCVGESASFTAAAKRLQITVSGVSRAIARLEDTLQVRLLNRSTRSITLTTEGLAYFERCRQILAALDDAEHEIANTRAVPRGRLRIQLPRALGKQIVVPALANFCDQYPNIHVDVLLDGRSLNLEKEGIDVALRYGMPSDSPLVARQLCPVFHVLCASPDYIRRYGRPNAAGDISKHRLIGHSLSEGATYERWYFSKNDITRAILASSMLNVNDIAAVADAAAEGAGIAYLTDFIAARYVAQGALRIVLPTSAFEGLGIYMAYPRRKYVPPRVVAIREFLKKTLPSPAPWNDTILEGIANA